jgi:restriction system protein
MTDTSREFLAKAAAQSVSLTIRALVAIWGFRARTYENVARIKADLAAAGLSCIPDFGQGDADTIVRVGMPAAGDEQDVGSADEDEPLELPPVALRVRAIPSASAPVMSVRPDQTLAEAQSLMSARDFSQLAVMIGPRELKGAVSWRSIARAHLARSSISLADTIFRAPVVHADDELLGQIDTIYRADFVFVRDEEDRVCGIVTAADLAGQFRDLTTPFFQLGEIEGRVRRCLERVFSPAEMRAVTRKNSVNDMVFRQYLDLLDDETRWQRMGWAVDRAIFISYLDEARKIRNRVMHFGEELTPDEKHQLSHCLNFMRALDPLP